MIDPEACEFLYGVFGGSYAKYKDWHWAIYGEAAANCLKKLKPYFKIDRRIANAEACIALYEKRIGKKWGPLTPEEKDRRELLFIATRNGGRKDT